MGRKKHVLHTVFIDLPGPTADRRDINATERERLRAVGSLWLNEDLGIHLGDGHITVFQCLPTFLPAEKVELILEVSGWNILSMRLTK